MKNCMGCGCPVRRRTEPKQAGTRLYDSHGMCSTCRSRQRRDTTPRPSRPDECVRCERPLRDRGAPPDGVTMEFMALGHCRSCYSVLERRRRREEDQWAQALGLT